MVFYNKMDFILQQCLIYLILFYTNNLSFLYKFLSYSFDMNYILL